MYRLLGVGCKIALISHLRSAGIDVSGWRGLGRDGSLTLLDHDAWRLEFKNMLSCYF